MVSSTTPHVRLNAESTARPAARIASGTRATRRLLRPRVFTDRRRVVVTIFTRPMRGPAAPSCPGNPETPYLLTLPHAVGTRALMDGKTLPAKTEWPRP